MDEVEQTALEMLAEHGGTFSVSKNPNAEEWVVSMHWFPTDVKEPMAAATAQGTGGTLDEAFEALAEELA